MSPYTHAIMRPIILFVCLFTFRYVPAQESTGIFFHHDITFQQASDQAKNEGKLIFMDCYTSWCGPCKRLASEVFTNPEVGAYYNANFVNVKFDMEKGEGVDIATKYQIRAYPTLLWLDYNGVIKHKVVGGLSPDGLLQAGQAAGDPLPGMIAGMDKKWAEGNRETAFLTDYIKALHGLRRDYAAPYDSLMKVIKPQEMTTEAVLKTIYEITDNINQPSINYLMQYKKQLTPLVTEVAYHQKIKRLAQDGLQQAIKATDEKSFNKATALVTFDKPKDSKSTLAKMEMDYYLNTSNAPVYDRYVTTYINKYAAKDEKTLNDIAWQYYLNTNEPMYLAKAKDWAFKAVNIKNCYTNNITYAYLQYKLGNIDEATKACDYAIIKAKEEGIAASAATALKEAMIKEAIK